MKNNFNCYVEIRISDTESSTTCFKDKVTCFTYATVQALYGFKVKDIYQVIDYNGETDKISLYTEFLDRLQLAFELHENTHNIHKLHNSCLERLLK